MVFFWQIGSVDLLRLQRCTVPALIGFAIVSSTSVILFLVFDCFALSQDVDRLVDLYVFYLSNLLKSSL